MLLLHHLINSPYNYCKILTSAERFRQTRHKVARNPSCASAQPAANLSLFLASNPPSPPSPVTLRCSGSHYPSVSKHDRRSAATVPFPFLLCQCISATLAESMMQGGLRVLEAAAKDLQSARTVTRQTAWPTDLQTEEEGADGDLQTAALI